MATDPNKGIPPAVAAAHQKLEASVLAAVQTFTAETRLRPSGVRVEMIDIRDKGDRRPKYAPIGVRLEFTL